MRCVQVLLSVENGPAAVGLNGAVLGDAPQLVTLLPPCDAFFSAIPTACGSVKRYAVTRKLTFPGARPAPPGNEDVRVFDWGNGLFEVALRAGELPPVRTVTFPRLIAEQSFEGRSAVLFSEDALFLALERNGRVETGLALGDAPSGALVQEGRRLVAVAFGRKKTAALLDENGAVLRLVTADEIAVERGQLLAVDRLHTLRGHERRTAYRLSDGLETAREVGFFTQEPAPAANVPRALCEALLLGRGAEAMDCLAPGYAAGLTPDALAAFFGAFTGLRESPLAGETELGLLGDDMDGVTRVRRFQFALEGDKIVNIAEES